jgi:competence protein ComEC
MSFAATGVLIATYEMWRRRALQTNSQRRGAVFWIKSLFVTSTVSSMATMPFAYFHFGRVAGLGIIANLAAMPVITLVSAPMAAAALILTPFGLEGLALRGFGLSLEWVLALAETFSARRVVLPIHLPRMPASSLAFFSAALIAYCVSEGFAIRAGSMLAFALIGIIAWTGSRAPRLHFAPSGEVFFESASGQIERYSVWEGDGLAPLQYADTPETSQCLETLQCHLELPSHTLERAHLGGLDMMVLSASPDHVTEIIPWTEIVAERGVTLRWREGTFIRQTQLSCGRRPWRPCRSIRIFE